MTSQEILDRISAHGFAVEEALVTMSTGVVLRLKHPSAWAMTDVQRQMQKEEPKVPVVYIEEKGRDEPNAADPRYLEALIDHETRLRERLYEVMIATGTEVFSVPDGFSRHEDDAWRLPLLAVGVTLSDKPERRYVEWVKYKAAPTNMDWVQVSPALLRRVGTAEEDVAEAAATFRGVPERGADSTSAPERDGANGD